MSLESLLTKVDEATWKQYEKVTNWAYDNYGWSKYDLATMSDRITGIFLVGGGTYCTMLGLSYSPPNIGPILVGTLLTLGSISGTYSSSKRNKKFEKEETDLMISSGAIPKPNFGSKRPWDLIQDTVLFSAIVVSSQIIPDDFSGNVGEYHLLAKLIATAYGFSSFGINSGEYFRSQLPKPPKAKKSVWQALYEPITKRLRKAVPLPEPNPETTNS